MTLPETPPPLPPASPSKQPMSGCAIAALVVIGIVLLLPGLCVMILAVSDGKIDGRILLFILAAVIIIVMVIYEMRRRRSR